MTLTEHAKLRISERLRLGEEGLIKLILERKAIFLGYETNTTKGHWLFYSPIDRDHFVVIIDSSSNEIITVVPYTTILHVFSALNSRMIKNYLWKTRRMWYASYRPEEFKIKKRFIFLFHYRNKNSNMLRKALYRVEAANFPGSAENPVVHHDLREHIMKAASKRCRKPEKLDAVYIRKMEHSPAEIYFTPDS